MKAENEQLRKDKAYLLDLLRETKEFGHLAEFIDDHSGAGVPKNLSKMSNQLGIRLSDFNQLKAKMMSMMRNQMLLALGLSEKFKSYNGKNL